MSSTFDHPHASRWHWWVVIIAGLLTLICGTVGGLEYEHAQHPGVPLTVSSFLGSAYSAFQMMVLHVPHFEGNANPWMESGRWLGVFTLVSTTWFLLWNRLRHEFRLMRLATWKNHYVICGLGHKGMAIIESIRFRAKHARIVVIDPDPDESLVDRCNELGVCIVKDDATTKEVLESARVARAGEIIAVTVEDEINIRVAAEVRKFRKKAKTHAFCWVHVANSHIPQALQQWTDTCADPNTTLRFFDVFDNEARRVLLGLPPANNTESKENDVGMAGQTAGVPHEGLSESMVKLRYASIDSDGIGPKDARSVHVVILGMGRMGTALAIRAAKMGHFANRKPLRISVIDRDAQRQMEQLFFRYPILAKPNEVCSLKPFQWQADSLEARTFIEQCAKEPDTVLHLFVCLDSNARAVEIGLRLWEIVAAHPGSYVNIRIKSKASLAPILETSGARIQAFGMLEDNCTEEGFLGQQREALARRIHEDFVAARLAEGQDPKKPSLAKWEILREDFRESNRQQADHMGIKMCAIGCRIVEAAMPGEPVIAFTAEEVEMLAELEHRRWNAERWLSGWRFGNETDKVRRFHNYLVAWNDLPNDIQEYDRQAVRNIRGLLAAMKPGLKVVRGTTADKT